MDGQINGEHERYVIQVEKRGGETSEVTNGGMDAGRRKERDKLTQVING